VQRNRSTAASIPRTLLVGNTCGCRQLLACAATPPFDVQSSGLFRPWTRYQTTFENRDSTRSVDVFVVTWKLFSSRSTNSYSALGASRLGAIAYKSTIDIDISTGMPASRGPSATAGLLVGAYCEQEGRRTAMQQQKHRRLTFEWVVRKIKRDWLPLMAKNDTVVPNAGECWL